MVKRVISPDGRLLSVTFTVPGVPVAQPRQRHAVRKIGGRAVAVNYTEENSPVNVYKATVRLMASQAYSAETLRGPLGYEIIAFFPRPKSAKGTERYWHTGKPDVDNLAKSTLDAGIGWLSDDKIISRIIVEKWVCGSADTPHVKVIIWELDSCTA